MALAEQKRPAKIDEGLANHIKIAGRSPREGEKAMPVMRLSGNHSFVLH
ncbi:hypothetical protein [Caproiciproducens sp. NJN-50]|nr:hypothetical protein [Caproiciproducens sp. NJN-50]